MLVLDNFRQAYAHQQMSLGAQGLEVLMENVTAVGFTSCALRHNAKLPDLALPGGMGGDAHKPQAGTNCRSPSAGSKAVGGAQSNLDCNDDVEKGTSSEQSNA